MNQADADRCGELASAYYERVQVARAKILALEEERKEKLSDFIRAGEAIIAASAKAIGQVFHALEADAGRVIGEIETIDEAGEFSLFELPLGTLFDTEFADESAHEQWRASLDEAIEERTLLDDCESTFDHVESELTDYMASVEAFEPEEEEEEEEDDDELYYCVCQGCGAHSPEAPDEQVDQVAQAAGWIADEKQDLCPKCR